MGDTINWGFFKRHFWGGLLRHQQVHCGSSGVIPSACQCTFMPVRGHLKMK
jgi:hypothetical protein